MDQALSDRVRDALTKPQGSSVLRALIGEVCADIANLAEAALGAHAVSIDPLASASEVKASRVRYGDLKHDEERAGAALQRLEVAAEQAERREVEERQGQLRDAAHRAKAKAAARLREVYPRAAMEIIEALEAVEAADALGFDGRAEEQAFGVFLSGRDEMWPLKSMVTLPARLGMAKSISRHGISSSVALRVVDGTEAAA